jgi:hypothetical protein
VAAKALSSSSVLSPKNTYAQVKFSNYFHIFRSGYTQLALPKENAKEFQKILKNTTIMLGGQETALDVAVQKGRVMLANAPSSLLKFNIYAAADAKSAAANKWVPLHDEYGAPRHVQINEESAASLDTGFFKTGK